MVLPLRALRTYCVIASELLCTFGTAPLAHFAIGTDLDAILTLAALVTKAYTVRAVFAAVAANVIDAVAAIITVAAHRVGTVDAYAAVRTEFVYTSGALAALPADVFRAVSANNAAILADFRTVAALVAVLAKQIVRTFAADAARRAEFIRAIRANLSTVRAEIRTIFAALAAGTYCSAVRAQSAGYAEAVRAGTVNTRATFRAQLAIRARTALFGAFRTDLRTV